MRKIPLKNYFILVLLLVISTIIVLYLINFYSEMQKQSSILPKYLGEVKYQEIDNIIIEKSNFVIYLSSKNDNKTGALEEKLKNFLIDNDLLKETIFMDIDQFDREQFIKKYYDNNYTQLETDVMIIIFENQTIKNILSKNKDEISINDIKNFFKENGVY